MPEPTSIINVGDLAKPADTLIKKVSNAIGAICEPGHIRRVARAKADAAMIEAEAQINITDLHRRAAHRWIEEEAKKQENMESIMAKALPQLEVNATPESVEDDWIANFFDKCRLVSDDEMQTLWSRVLAGEANRPGSYSKRTLSFLQSLDKDDANYFAAVCRFGWGLGTITPLIYNIGDKIYQDAGLSFNVLTHLDAIGLIKFENLAGYIRKGLPRITPVAYHTTRLQILFNNDAENTLKIGHVLLTQVGLQLARISGAQPVAGYLEYVLKNWQAEGLCVASVYPQ